jgi:hypothetical protein
MSLSTEYKSVIKRGEGQPPRISVHALFNGADETLCGMVDALDVEYPRNVNYVVTCGACNKLLKKERQRRSREGTARYQQRRAEERDAFKRDDAADVCIDGAPISEEEREVLVIALRQYIDGPYGEPGSNSLAESMLSRIAGE